MTLPSDLATRLQGASSIEIIADNPKSPLVSVTHQSLTAAQSMSLMRRSQSMDRWENHSSIKRSAPRRLPSFPPIPSSASAQAAAAAAAQHSDPNAKVSSSRGAESAMAMLRKPSASSSTANSSSSSSSSSSSNNSQKRVDEAPSLPTRRHDVHKTLDCLTKALSITVVNNDTDTPNAESSPASSSSSS